ncbi:PQQ-like beta-propeller repeat protein [Dyadobacter sp. CY261]|uniref:outer membrane protein assembly factor BamB family protein n=1 Tax=Dyadobacter sp. CY261 TaxID=2907203 RepID=UPI001F3F63E8|nr:PQQ-binding-like beta-propeller repeat protein [Dyadobacter sp. CY261]MCF0075281.1 PQQ-like beta-propeller repeat protein [Dyadobacter sp. CY261]
MVRPLAILIVACLLFSSCKEKLDLDHNPDGSVSERRTMWKTAVNTDRYFATGLRTNITYNGGVLVPYSTGIPFVAGGFSDRGGIALLDGETGKERWRWQGYMYERELFDIQYAYLQGNLMVFPSGPRTHCINLDNGQTAWQKWKQDTVYSQYTMSGLGNSYYFCGSKIVPGSNPHSALYRGNILAPQPEELVAAPQLPVEYLEETPILFGATSMAPTVIEGDTVIVVDYQTPTAEARYNYIRSVYGLYNLSKKKWVYKDIPLVDPQPGTVVDWLPVIYEGKIYHSVGRFITCHDLLTGERKWYQTFTQDFLMSGFIVSDGVVVANCEDTYIYGFDVNSGAQLWREKSSGSSTKLFAQEGFVYFAGGGDGLLHAVEIKTGRTWWKLESPDLKKNGYAYFQQMVSGIPAKAGRKGRVYASTGIHIYAFEAIR